MTITPTSPTGRNPFFEIRKENVITTDTGMDCGKVALINQETNGILGLVSPNYVPILNKDIANLFDDALTPFDIKDVSDHMNASTSKWKRHYIIGDNFAEVLPGDSVGLLVEVGNGFDGKTSHFYNIMGYRDRCSNGQVFGRNDLYSESYRHFTTPDKLAETLLSKFEMVFKNIEIWKAWSDVPFTKEQFTQFVEAHNNENDRYLTQNISKELIENFQIILDKQKLEATKYGAYNVLTYYLTHETKARGEASHIFSNSYRNVSRLTADFYEWDGLKVA